jgi:hypothetical protein
MCLEFYNSRNINNVVKYQGQQEEWKVIVDGLMIETLHTLKQSAMHNPS